MKRSLRSDSKQLHAELIEWYRDHKRELPWRQTSDPYAVWVSEVMLQQTQVATVIPFYERWMKRFPTVESLANVSEQEALTFWQGLGYYRRCRMLIEGARYLVKAGLPQTNSEWLKVPGVGRYTAGAISSICFGESAPLVDGNVARVFARLTACPASKPELTSRAWLWAEETMPQRDCGD